MLVDLTWNYPTVIAVPGEERQQKISLLLVKCPAQLCDELDKKEFDVTSIYDAAQPECPSATVTPLYADFEMKELVEDQACVVTPSAAGDQRNTVQAEPNSAKTCGWVGQLGQVDHHLRMAHRGDKRWIKDSPVLEPDQMHWVLKKCSSKRLQRFFLCTVVITLIVIVVEARILFSQYGPKNPVPKSSLD